MTKEEDDKIIDELLDYRNKHLWENLINVCDINIDVGDYNNYGVFSKGETHLIYIPKNQLCISSFTHELLHIYLETKSIRIGNLMLIYIKEKKLAKIVLTEGLLEHIGNCLAHIKMLPIFEQMGFDKSEFLSDYNVNKLEAKEIKDLKGNFKKKTWYGRTYYDKTNIDLYIGKFFAANACPNSNYNYTDGLSELKLINSGLYGILNEFLFKWINFDIKKIDDAIQFADYSLMQFEFVDSLENWFKNNRVK